MDIPCKTCDEGLLQNRTQYLLNAPLAFLGNGCLVLAGLSALFVAIGVVGMLGRADELSSDGDPTQTGSFIFAMLLVYGPIIFSIVVATGTGLLLARKKKVLQCSNCGAVTALG